MLDEDTMRLLRWDLDNPLADDAYSRILGHPAFPAAARALAANMDALSEGDRVLDGVFKDAGRYVTALWAMYLDADEAITLPRLKAVCVASGLLSPGRARAMLLYLLHLGYLTPSPATGARAPVRYRPTPAFIDAWTRQLRAALDAAALIEPGAAQVRLALADPAALRVFCRHHARGLLEGARSADHDTPWMRVIMHRHAGNQIGHRLAMVGDGDDFPTTEPIALNAGLTARRYGVSRVHVRRLIDAAVAEGLMVTVPGGVRLLEPARTMLRWLSAAQLLQLLIASAKTLRQARNLQAGALAASA